MNKKIITYSSRGGVIAALYIVLTFLSTALGISFGPLQFRFSEALCILPVFFPEAVPALAIGCFISNLASPYGMADIVFGTSATLLAALVTYIARNIKIKNIPFLSLLSPVLFNAVIVGAEIALLSNSVALFPIAALEVGAGELAVMLLLGLPLYVALSKRLTKR